MSTEAFQNLCAIYSDMHKDTYGFRPRGVFEGKTLEDVEAMIADLEPALDREIARERAENLAAIERMEKLISDTVSIGAVYRRDAMAWLIDTYLPHSRPRIANRYELEGFFYDHGLLSAEAYDLRQEFISVVEGK